MGAIVAVSVLLIGSWFFTVEYLRHDLEANIAELTHKTDLLTQMRDHARSRAISLHRMALLEDRFAREDEYLRLLNYGDLFLQARNQFLALPLSTREQTLYDGLLPLVARGKETQERAIEALQSGNFVKAQHIVLHEIIPAQESSVAALNMLFDAERDATRDAVETTRAAYDTFKSIIVGLGSALLAACVFAAYVVTRRIQQSKRDLLGAVDAARRADAMKCEFLARVSHELRTPLTAILGYTELLLEEHDKDRQLVRDVERIRSSGQHLLGLIDDVLDLSRIEAGRYRMLNVAIDVAKFVDELADEVKLNFRRNGNTLHVSCPPGTSLSTDPRALRQILLNLLSNADKFTERGHVDLVVASDSVGTLRFSVKDNGIGMSAEQQERIFEPFVQGAPDIAARFGGSGLGLSIVRQLCTVVDAQVTVESALGQGSRFTITFAARR